MISPDLVRTGDEEPQCLIELFSVVFIRNH